MKRTELQLLQNYNYCSGYYILSIKSFLCQHKETVIFASHNKQLYNYKITKGLILENLFITPIRNINTLLIMTHYFPPQVQNDYNCWLISILFGFRCLFVVYKYVGCFVSYFTHTQTQTHIHKHTHKHTHTQTQTHTHIHKHTHTNTHIYTNTHTQTQTHTHIYIIQKSKIYIKTLKTLLHVSNTRSSSGNIYCSLLKL